MGTGPVPGRSRGASRFTRDTCAIPVRRAAMLPPVSRLPP